MKTVKKYGHMESLTKSSEYEVLQSPPRSFPPTAHAPPKVLPPNTLFPQATLKVAKSLNKYENMENCQDLLNMKSYSLPSRSSTYTPTPHQRLSKKITFEPLKKYDKVRKYENLIKSIEYEVL